MQRRFLRKRGAVGGDTPSVIAYGDATFPKGTASVVATKFPASPKGVPLGELAANAVSRLRGYWPFLHSRAYQRLAGAALHQQFLPGKAGEQGDVAAPCREFQRLAVGIVEGKGALGALRPCDLP